MRNRLDLGVAGKIARIVRREQYSLDSLPYGAHGTGGQSGGKACRRADGLSRAQSHVAQYQPAVAESDQQHCRAIQSATGKPADRGFGKSQRAHDPAGIRSTSHYRGAQRRADAIRSSLPQAASGAVDLGHGGALPPAKRDRNFAPRAGAIAQARTACAAAGGRRVRIGRSTRKKFTPWRPNLGLEDIIEWTGFTSDVTSELLTMDLFVLPSLFGEGLPMVVLEAMAAGVPVVATDVEGIPEAIRHGQDGVIAPAGDPKALAQAMIDVIEGKYDWSAMRDSALTRQAQFFSQYSMAEGVAEVYRQVLETEGLQFAI